MQPPHSSRDGGPKACYRVQKMALVTNCYSLISISS
jgi:hypothetical protein